MFSTRSSSLVAAFLLAVATIGPSSADSHAGLRSGLEPPSQGSQQDYWSASRMSLQLAHEHQRLSQTEAACEALAQSLDYYRLALAKETGATYGEIARSRADDEGMQEIRARFGCSARQLS